MFVKNASACEESCKLGAGGVRKCIGIHPHAGATQFLADVSPDVVDGYRLQLLVALDLLVDGAFTGSQFPVGTGKQRIFREVLMKWHIFLVIGGTKPNSHLRSSMTLACSFSSLMSTTLLVNFLPRASITWFPCTICLLGSMVSCEDRTQTHLCLKTVRKWEPKRLLNPRIIISLPGSWC